MEYSFSFEKLEAWKESRLLATKIYKITIGFPDYEKFGIVSQMRRSVISVSSNLAEGSSRNTFKEQAYFYQMAYGSLMELLSLLIISTDLGFMSENTLNEIRADLEKTSRLTGALRKSRINTKP
ncbi:MAG: four helix bundle protein [Bacteroidetes bacterium]|nr:MAG: four helix bundle protein [Bacteroidota bacterium]